MTAFFRYYTHFIPPFFSLLPKISFILEKKRLL